MRFRYGAGIVLALAITACDETGTQVAISQANIRAVHGSPDAPSFDLAVDGQTMARDLDYTDASGYVQVNPGNRFIQIRQASTTLDATTDSLVAVGNKRYTVIALNRVAVIESVVLTDDPTVPGADSARVRLVHGAPSASTVDIYVTAPNVDLASVTPTVEGLSFRASSTYHVIPAGTYRVRVTSAGTRTVALDIPVVPIGNRQILTVVALDAAGGGPPFTLKMLSDAR